MTLSPVYERRKLEAANRGRCSFAKTVKGVRCRNLELIGGVGLCNVHAQQPAEAPSQAPATTARIGTGTRACPRCILGYVFLDPAVQGNRVEYLKCASCGWERVA